MLPLFSGKMKRAAAIFFPVLFAYSIVLTGDFVLDDHVLVEKNAFIKELKAPHLYFAQEAYFVDHDTYVDISVESSGAEIAALGLTLSKGVTAGGSGSASGYSMSAYHTSGSGTWTVAMPGGKMELVKQ